MKTVIMILMAMVLTTGNMYGQTESQAPPIPSEEQPEVLTRGPVNEAFAQPVNLEEESGFIAPKAPPEDIDEVPPAERPVGAQFAWVPGYWAWDTDRNDYIWVSGCWRSVPPGKYWVPGYWAEVQNGWRWVEGFWAPISSKEIEYLPPPPAVTYVEPPAAASPDMIWVPSCWYWYNGHYTLRSGYWIAAREDWVWVPSHYVWTPRGYVFVSGHWDYPFRSRGVLFAPVYFPRHYHSRVRFSYSLNIAIDLGNLEFGIFTRPSYNHYYFGDYYDSFYIGIGIFPWFECVTRHTWYDPIYIHDRWRHRRHDNNWWQHERREYERRRDDRNLRPPRTYHEMERRVRSMTVAQRRNFEVASPMKRIVENKTTAFRFRQDKPEVRKQISREAEDMRKYSRERSQWESSGNRSITTRQKVNNQPPVEYRDNRATKERKEINIRKAEPSDKNITTERKEVDIRKTEPRDKHITTDRQEINTRKAVPREPSGKENSRSGKISESSRETVQKAYRQVESPNVSQREERQDKSDNVKVRTSPVVDRNKGGFFRKKAPSQPDEERESRSKRK